MNDITLRQISGVDGDFIYRVRKESFSSYLAKVSTWDEGEQRHLHEQRLAAQEFRIVQVAGQDVGYMAIMRKRDCFRMNQLFILPEHEHKGAGRACMQWLIQESEKTGLPIRLLVRRSNRNAQKFYGGFGFRETRQGENHIMMERLPAAVVSSDPLT